MLRVPSHLTVGGKRRRKAEARGVEGAAQGGKCRREKQHGGREEAVGSGRRGERAGPGKGRRTVTLARWEPSAWANMCSILEGETIDVTGD